MTLNDYSRKMMRPGYNQSERYNVIKGSVERFNQMVNDSKAGIIKSLHRSKKEIMEAKLSRKSWANTWFLKGQVAGTMSCQATPGGTLAKIIQQNINSDRTPGNKLQVLEDGGRSITASLNTRDPFWNGGCVFGDINCIVKNDQRCSI